VVGNRQVPTVLLHGETGTGKGLVARVIHDSGPRAHGPFIEINCAAIPETLLEAELYGVAAGAFTGAKRAKPGLFEAASGGTLLFDEIDALPLALQGKVLTAIEAKRVRRLGAVAERAVDVKLIAATQAELSVHVREGKFRGDLYQRLAVVLLDLPPLRERGEDVWLLAEALLRQYAEAYRLPPKRLSTAAEAWLRAYPWPGNVRELNHLLERVMLLSAETIIDPDTLERWCLPRLPSGAPKALARAIRADEDDATRIAQALRHTGGNVERAARLLGFSRKAVRYRMRKYGIARVQEDAKSPRPHPAAPGVPVGPSASMGEAPGQERADRLPRWEQKLVAVLALEVTWPAAGEGEAPRYEPWTVVTRWGQLILEKVHGFGGVCLQRSPSLLLAAFGLPHTLEQLPQRAVQAALAVQRLVADAPQGEIAPDLRQAVHWGQVLVETASTNPTAGLLPVGEVLALPVRLLGRVAPGEIVVSPTVGRLVEGWFALQAREGGLGTEAYLVVGLKPRPSPLRMHSQRPLSPFVGRARELATLDALLEQATGGRGQVVGLVGEPGVGKSRLLYEFQQRLTGYPVTYLEGHCLPYGSNTPYLPMLDLLRQHCGIVEADDADTIRENVSGALQRLGMVPDAGMPYLLPLLGVPTGTDQLAGVDPKVIKARTFETLRQLLLHGSQRQPLVLAVENLHWIDPTSEDFFTSVVEHVAGARLILLLTYRPQGIGRRGSRNPTRPRSSCRRSRLRPAGGCSRPSCRRRLSPKP
jgi:MoxR-like ATPase